MGQGYSPGPGTPWAAYAAIAFGILAIALEVASMVIGR